MPRPERVWTVVVGGGSGRRFGKPKQFEMLGKRRVIDRSRAVAEQASEGVVVVVPPDAVAAERGVAGEHVVAGGATRTDSVRAGLDVVPTEATIICVHDAARPLASAALYGRVVNAVANGSDGAVPAVAVSDTIKVVTDGVVVDTPERSTLVAVQTPQAFRADVLRAAHAQARTAGRDATDDAALVESAGGRVVVVDGDVDNRKITQADDLEWARRALGRLDESVES